MNTYSIKAYAKINLGLDVCGRLENGYHIVKMIMQSVGIYDELIFTKTDGPVILKADGTDLPLDENNLIVKAVELMRKEYGIRDGVSVELTKNIPIAAGMAGGSTDAAAALKAMNVMFELGLSEERLKELGVRLGADIPYCIMGKTALAEGIGEKLYRLPDMPECYLLVAKPDIDVSTKYVYEHLDAKTEITHPDIDGMISAIENNDLQGVADRLGNVLEEVTVEAHPIVAHMKAKMLEAGAMGSLMSGSGPTVFGIFTDRQKALDACKIMKEAYATAAVFVTEPV